MSALLTGYARVSTTGQDLAAQRRALTGLGVPEERIYVNHGLTGTNALRHARQRYAEDRHVTRGREAGRSPSRTQAPPPP